MYTSVTINLYISMYIVLKEKNTSKLGVSGKLALETVTVRILSPINKVLIYITIKEKAPSGDDPT